MRIQIDQQYKKLCYIQQIKPGRLNFFRIILCVLLSILACGIPLVLYLKWQKFKSFIHFIIFQELEEDSKQTNYYLIVDSKRCQKEFRTISYRNHIIQPFLVRFEKPNQNIKFPSQQAQGQYCKYIEHKNLRYLIKNNTLYSLKFKIKKSFDRYFHEGLLQGQIKQSNQVYGKGISFSLSFIDVLKKILSQKALRFTFMFFAIKKIIVGLISISKNDNEFNKANENEFMVAIMIIVQISISLIITVALSILGASQHNKIHNKIQNDTKYSIIRNGQKIEVKLIELSVGDIVIPKIGDIIYFKGLLVGDQIQSDEMGYTIVNQKLYNRHDEPIQKNTLLSHLNQITQINIINPGSQILNMSIKQSNEEVLKDTNTQDKINESDRLRLGKIQNKVYQSGKAKNKKQTIKTKGLISIEEDASRIQRKPVFFIIVTDNNFMQKFYASHRQSHYWDNFSSMRTNYDLQQIIFQSIFLILSIIATLWVMENKNRNQHWFNILLSHIVLCFPFNLAMFCNVSQIISIIRLRKQGVKTINPAIQQIGMIDNISFQLSVFEKIQFSGFVKKQRCTRMPVPQRFQIGQNLFQMYYKAREQSIFGFLLWAGMVNLPYLQDHAIYKQLFQKYEFFHRQPSQFDQSEHSKKRILNKDDSTIKIDWIQHQRFPISQKLIQTVIVQDVYASKFENKFIIISQGQYTNEECQDYFDEIILEEGRVQFRNAIRRLFLQGKRIKYISFKRNFIKDQKQLQIKHFNRQYIENKLQFCGFLIFDQWPTEESMKSLVQIDEFSDGNNVTIFSNRPLNNLIGYDHILRKSKILFQQSSQLRFLQTFQNKKQHENIIFIGHGIIDQGSLLLADVSMNLTSKSYGQADFQLNSCDQVMNLIYEGFWSLYNTSLTIVCLVLFNFSKIIGQIFKYQNNPQNKVEPSPLADSFDQLFLIDIGALILPIFLLNIYIPNKKLTAKNHRHFFRMELVFYVFFSLMGLISLYTIQFLDHKFENICQIESYTKNNSNKFHFLTTRLNKLANNHLTENFQPCQGIIFFINISFSFLVILIFDRSSLQRKAPNKFLGLINKLYMFGLWIWSFLHFQLPLKIILRSAVVIFILALFVEIIQWINKKKQMQRQIKQDQEERQAIPQQFIQF